MSARRMKGGGLIALAIIGSCLLPIAAQSNPHIDAATLDDTDILNQTVDEERLNRVFAAYLAEDGLQTERPVWTPEPLEVQQREFRQPSGFALAFARFMAAIGPFIGYLLLIAIVIVIAIAVYYIFGESLSLRRRQKPEKQQSAVSEIPNLRPEKTAAIALLEDADALAAAGRFAEAVHLLLFRSISEIQAHQKARVSRALTAREIGRLDALPSRVRATLAPIIKIVERSFFGGQDVDQAGWKTARASYQDFAFGGAWT